MRPRDITRIVIGALEGAACDAVVLEDLGDAYGMADISGQSVFATVRHHCGLKGCPFSMIIIEIDSSEKNIDCPFERIDFSKQCTL